ncbi:DUF436 family protein [Oceanithermus sp.]
MKEIELHSREALVHLLKQARKPAGGLLVVGGSTSAIRGKRIGKAGDLDSAFAVLSGILPLVARYSLTLAVQGCEHINRSLAIPRVALERYRLTEVSVVPVPKAGGSLASAYYSVLDDPVMVADLGGQALLGLDIGGVLVGMHLKPVAVPVWFGELRIGSARLTGGYSRPRRVGGERAVYDRRVLDELLS